MIVTEWAEKGDLKKIIKECHHHHLSNLTHLYFIDCYLQNEQTDFQSMVNNIWNLPNLIHCTLNIVVKGKCSFCVPHNRSSSLISLSVERAQITLDQIDQLIKCTPNLRSLVISVLSFANNNYIPVMFHNLRELTIKSVFTCNARRMSFTCSTIPSKAALEC